MIVERVAAIERTNERIILNGSLDGDFDKAFRCDYEDCSSSFDKATSLQMHKLKAHKIAPFPKGSGRSGQTISGLPIRKKLVVDDAYADTLDSEKMRLRKENQLLGEELTRYRLLSRVKGYDTSGLSSGGGSKGVSRDDLIRILNSRDRIRDSREFENKMLSSLGGIEKRLFQLEHDGGGVSRFEKRYFDLLERPKSGDDPALALAREARILLEKLSESSPVEKVREKVVESSALDDLSSRLDKKYVVES